MITMQPIASAPRDGTPLYAVSAEAYQGVAFVVAYRPSIHFPEHPWVNCLTYTRLRESVPKYWWDFDPEVQP